MKTEFDAYRQMAMDFDGCEVPRDHWHIAEQIVKDDPDHFSLGGARGPNGDWRRLEYYE